LLPDGFQPTGLNRWGTIVGWGTRGNVSVVKRYSITLVPSLEGLGLQPIAISDSGMVIAEGNTELFGSRAVAWTKERGAWDLGGPRASVCDPGVDTTIIPLAVNTGGHVAGLFEDGYCTEYPVRWDDSGMHRIIRVGQGVATDVNAQDQIAGLKSRPDGADGVPRADGFVWQAGQPLRVFRLLEQTIPTAINDEGVMIGTAGNTTQFRYWVWVPGHAPRLMPDKVPPGLSPGVSFDLLTNTRIYGRGLDQETPFSWDTNGNDRQPIRLRGGWNMVGGIIAANDRGHLIAAVRNSTSGREAYVLATPIPGS